MKTVLFSTLLIVSTACLFVQEASLKGKDEGRIVQDIENVISEEQEKLIEKFQAQNIQLLTNNYLASETFAFGLLTANKWNLLAATKNLKRITKWRNANKIEKLGEAETNSKMLKSFPYRLTAVTREGCPVLEMDAGKWLVSDYIESQEFVRDAVEAFNRYDLQMLEKTRMNLGVKCEQAVMLMDMKNYTAKNYGEPIALSAIVRMGSNLEVYYPNLFKKIIVINSNNAFANLFDISGPFMGQVSKQISLFTEVEKEHARKLIYKYIAPEQLTPEYYGTKTVERH